MRHPATRFSTMTPKAAALRIERDCAGVRHNGGAFAAFDLFFAEGTEDEVFDAWFAALGCRARTGKKAGGLFQLVQPLPEH